MAQVANIPRGAIEAAAKAESFVSQAEKRRESICLFGSGRRREDMAELYNKAAVQYKVAKMYQEAGQSFVTAGDLHRDTDDMSESMHCYKNAAHAYKQCNVPEAVKYFTLYALSMQDNNRFSAAARVYKEIGELLESEGKLKEAITAFEQAADAFEAEDSTVSASQLRLRIADLEAEQGHFGIALPVYEAVARVQQARPLTQHIANKTLFKAALCTLARDPSSAEAVHRLYQEQCSNYARSREGALVAAVVEAMDTLDVEEFERAVAAYDAVTRLDPVCTRILLGTKRALTRKAEAFDDSSLFDHFDFR